MPKWWDHVHFSDGKYMHVCSYMKRFMFDPREVNSKITNLSGGESNRLLLAKMLINPGNVLILDEPTNDLDMDSLEILLEILSDYDGTAIIVSHDRDFLDRLVTRSLVFEGDGKIVDLVGSYEDYLKFSGPKKLTISKPRKEPKSSKSKSVLNRLSYKDQRLSDIIPGQINELEKINLQLEEDLSAPNLYESHLKEFTTKSQKLSDNQTKIAELTEIWMAIEGKQ
jgi:ATP-binding cassette subfamily F protein uup